MDYIKVVEPKQMYGVPLGGLGGGTIGRGFRGEFCRIQMKPGMYEYQTIDANQFILTVQNEAGQTIYQNVLSSNSAPKGGNLSSWKWEFPGDKANYTALYPRSWTEYDVSECNLKLVCKQISPVIPHNYKDSCIPGGVFIWSVENLGNKPLNITITFTLKSYGNGASCDPFEYDHDGLDISGIQIYNDIEGMKCTYSVAVKREVGIEIGTTCFNPNGSGQVLWQQLKEDGMFTRTVRSTTRFYGEMGAAVAAKTCVPGSGVKNLEFSFIWDMPKVRFHGRRRTHLRYYTKYFQTDKKLSYIICHYALRNYPRWEKEIDNWQQPILDNSDLPDWYKSAIFNELYFLSDGGTVWLLLEPNEIENLSMFDARREYGRFAYLEGHEYRMYNTYDVHFYASFALADLWPKLQASIQYEFRDTVDEVDTSIRWYLWNGKIGLRKYPHSIPHDLGDPEDEPFLSLNSYPVHNVAHWRDLNLKFILQCYRDYTYMKDENYLKDMWPHIKRLMKTCLSWDTDQDGMIENGGSADQTYDCWTMTGVSAYCGCLWIASLYVVVKMADILNDEEVVDTYSSILTKAKTVYNDRLWNGKYYIFDSSGAAHSTSVMADQLCGIWYLRACNVDEEVLPIEKVKRALLTIFENNVCKFNDGGSGAVNGMMEDGQVDDVSVQSEEVWTGITYALASHYVFQGMIEEGMRTAHGIYDTVYNKIGMGFETPEALYQEKYIRAVGYMRSLSIWSIQIAFRQSKQHVADID